MNALKLIGIGLLCATLPAMGCGSTSDGTTVECGSNWIRFRQSYESFRNHHGMGSGTEVRHGQIIPGCFVYGPYASIPFAGQLTGYFKVEALVDKASIHGVIDPNTPMFTMDLTSDVGQNVLGSRTATFGQFYDWSGDATPYSRCTGADPCTAGGPGIAHRNFKVYTNFTNLDVIGRTISGPLANVEVRICNLNPILTSVHPQESVLELTY